MTDQTATIIGTWTLAKTEVQPAQKSLKIGYVSEDTEMAFADDERELVKPADFQPGGQYYSVVKLQIHYEKQDPADPRWAQGTGWLIKPDLLVTAGHCVYDHTWEFGRAVQIKAYVGYSGESSIGQPNVQFRQGAKIATTGGWLQSDVNRANDVGFVQLDKPFEMVTPIQFKSTPSSGTLSIGVVGYPADLHNGDHMYSMYRKTAFDLGASTLNMLEYTISTYSGENTSIGAHVYGLGTRNLASVIRGQYGNFYTSAIDTFSKSYPCTQIGDITYMTIPKPEDDLSEPMKSDAEDFWSTFRNVVKVGTPVVSGVLSAGSPFLGPIGSPIAAVAGTVLGYAGKLAGSKADSSLTQDFSYKDHCARAVLGEAALATVLRMDVEQAEKYQVFSRMQDSFTKNKKTVKPIARILGPALVGPALRMALQNSDPALAKAAESSFPPVASSSSTESAMDDQYEYFVYGLEKAASSHGETESFLSFLKPLAKIGIKAAPTVINVLGSILGSGSESSFASAEDHLQPHVEVLWHRALMGDAALQALMAIPPNEMKEEGFFGDMISTIKKIGSTVLSAAPGVIRTITPILNAYINSTKSESNLTGKLPIKQSPGLTAPGLKTKPSIAHLLADHSNGQPPAMLSCAPLANGGPANGVPNGNPSKVGGALEPQRDGLAWRIQTPNGNP